MVTRHHVAPLGPCSGPPLAFSQLFLKEWEMVWCAFSSMLILVDLFVVLAVPGSSPCELHTSVCHYTHSHTVILKDKYVSRAAVSCDLGT